MYITVDFPLSDARSRLGYWQFERVIVSSGECRCWGWYAVGGGSILVFYVGRTQFEYKLGYLHFERFHVSSGEFRDRANICEIEVVQNTFHTHSLRLHPIAFDVVNLYSRSQVVTLRNTRFYVKEFGRMCGRSLMVTGIRTGYLLIMLQLCQPLDTR